MPFSFEEISRSFTLRIPLRPSPFLVPTDCTRIRHAALLRLASCSEIAPKNVGDSKVAVVKDQGVTRGLLTDCRAVKRVLGAAPRGNLVRFHELRFIQVNGFSWSKQEFSGLHGRLKGQTVKPI